MKQNKPVYVAHNLMKSYHLKIGFNVPNVCSGVTIDVSTDGQMTRLNLRSQVFEDSNCLGQNNFGYTIFNRETI